MATALHANLVFGPIKSRRLGTSLGVNLLPLDSKLCNFNCIYCECGWNTKTSKKLRFPSKDLVLERLLERLKSLQSEGVVLDVITFAGNGEPTMHPDFLHIIEQTIELRNQYAPQAKIAVLTNATLVEKGSVRRALQLVDRAILKIDSGFRSTIEIVNQPAYDYSLPRVIDSIKTIQGEVIIQTMFLRGSYNGINIDNTESLELQSWLEVIADINPSQVMVYSIDRDTPAQTLEKVSKEELEKIAEKVRKMGIECSVA